MFNQRKRKLKIRRLAGTLAVGGIWAAETVGINYIASLHEPNTYATLIISGILAFPTTYITWMVPICIFYVLVSLGKWLFDFDGGEPYGRG